MKKVPDIHSLSTKELWKIFVKDKTNILARNILVERNIPLAISVLRGYMGYDFAFDELRSIASLALIKAVNNYELNKGFQFSTFATKCIEHAMVDAIKTKDNSIPRTLGHNLHAIHKIVNDELKVGNPAPSSAKIAERSGLTAEMVEMSLNSEKAHQYCDTLGNETQNQGFFSRESDFVEEMANNELLKTGMYQLPERERDIIRRFYFDGKTFKEIAAEYGISRSRIGQIIERAKSRMKEYFLEHGVDSL